MKTEAYPNYDFYFPQKKPRDLSKWMQTVREIYYLAHKGEDKQSSLEKITKDWDKMEKLDFKNWLKFYEENAQNKYKEATVKTAQMYWNDLPRFDKPMTMETVKNPETHPDLIQDERKQTIERQRQKIISRLDSAEKLLRQEEGHMLAGKEYESVIAALYQLKTKIQMVNKISTSVRLYQDMIIREANILVGNGFNEGSNFLTKIAQALPSVQEASNPIQVGEGQAGTLPGEAPGQVSPPSGSLPVDVSMPTEIPGTPQNAAPPDVAVPTSNTPSMQEPLSEGLKEFLDGLDDANISTEDEDQGENEDFVVEAQMQESPAEPPLEVEEDPEVVAGKDFDALLDQTLANITVEDVITKLEDVANIFKTREIPRQLSVVDLMLDKLGLASFFPELNEAMGKSAEMTGYVGSRIETILSRLRGTIQTKPLDLKNDMASPPNPAAQQLQQDADKEQAKKQMRKEVEEQKLMAPKPSPEIEVQEDLGAPAALQQAAPPPAAIPPAPIK